MRIELNELKAICEKLLVYLEENGVTSIDIGSDQYWRISADKRYNPYEEPNSFERGNLDTDWQSLKTSVANNTISKDSLILLVSLYRAIGEESKY